MGSDNGGCDMSSLSFYSSYSAVIIWNGCIEMWHHKRPSQGGLVSIAVPIKTSQHFQTPSALLNLPKHLHTTHSDQPKHILSTLTLINATVVTTVRS